MEVSFLADNPHESIKIAQWYFDEWACTVPNVTLDMVHEKVLDRSKSKLEIPLIVTVHDEQELVGAAELKYRENKHYPEYEHWVGGVYVKPTHRGKGYSSALISKAKEHANKLGIKSLYLQCKDHNIGLYVKHGFQALHETEHNSVKRTIMVYQTGA